MKNERLERLRRDLEEWSRQESRLSASEARERVVARLDAVRGRRGWQRGLAAAVAAAAVAAILLSAPWERQAEPVASAAAEPATTARLLVYELRSGTTLYLPLPTDSTGAGL